MKGKLAGVAVELDTLTDPDVAKAYEDSIDEILEKMSEAKLKECGSDGIRMQCEVVMMAIQNVFGEDIKNKIFGAEYPRPHPARGRGSPLCGRDAAHRGGYGAHRR